VISNQAFRYELDPNVSQRVLLAKHAGCARFAWNWGLRERIRRYEENEGQARFSTAVVQHRELNARKALEFPWMYEVSKCAPQEALRDLDRAFRNFVRGLKSGRHWGFPRFKRKWVHDAFRLTGSIQVDGHGVHLPRLARIRTKEGTDQFRGRILSATVVREADRWYVSLTVEVERKDPKAVVGGVAGIDLGLTCFAKISDGSLEEAVASPKPLARRLELLKRRGRQHSRKVRGSRNQVRSALRLARLHRRIRNVRSDFLHKLSTTLAKAKSVVVLEDLNVSGMVRNHSLARSISDAGWSSFRRMLKYKSQWYGSRLVLAPRFFPSTKTCSGCGHVIESLPLHMRSWACPSCGALHDRDENAARNLVAWYQLSTGSSPGSNACGESSGGKGSLPFSHGSQKQESTTGVRLHG
jgi:putative transposase